MPTGNEDEAMPTRTEDEVNPTRTDTYRGQSQPNMYPHAPRTKSPQHVPRTTPRPTGNEGETNPRHIPRTKSTRHVPTHTGDKVNPICTHTHRGLAFCNTYRGQSHARQEPSKSPTPH